MGQSHSAVDRALQWIVLAVTGIGSLIYSFGVVTELDRIFRDPMEDGILPGFAYCLATALGASRSIWPNLPRAFHSISALANVLMGLFVIFVFVALLVGELDSGAALVPFVLLAIYLLALRATRFTDHFAPPIWFAVAVGVVTFALFLVLNSGLRSNLGATIAGAIYIALTLLWVIFLGVGLLKARRVAGMSSPPAN